MLFDTAGTATAILRLHLPDASLRRNAVTNLSA